MNQLVEAARAERLGIRRSITRRQQRGLAVQRVVETWCEFHDEVTLGGIQVVIDVGKARGLRTHQLDAEPE